MRWKRIEEAKKHRLNMDTHKLNMTISKNVGEGTHSHNPPPPQYMYVCKIKPKIHQKIYTESLAIKINKIELEL